MGLIRLGEGLKFLWQAIRVYKYSAIFLFSIILASALAETVGLGMIMPFLEIVLDAGGSSSGSVKYLYPLLRHFPESRHLIAIGALLVGLILIKNILLIFRVGFSTYFVNRFKRLWQTAIMEKYMFAEYPFLISNKQGVLLNNLLIEPGRAAKSLEQLTEFSSKAVLAFSLYCLLLIASWKATLFITLIAAAITFMLRKSTYNYAIGVGRRKVSLSQELAHLGAENINAIRQIKIFSLENETTRRFREKIEELVRIMLKFRIVERLPSPIAETLLVAGVVLSLVYLNYIAKVPLVNIAPVLGLFIITSQRFVPVVSQLFAERMSIITLIPSLKITYDLYNSTVKGEELDKGEDIARISGAIEFRDVYFGHTPSKPLFRGLNMTIPEGKITAIVGPSGSGKTTLVDLLTGIFKKEKGEILINGMDIDRISLSSCRRLIGYVSQETFIFNATARENILVGKPGASEEEIINAARKAHADEFIRQLPQGYETVLGDRGTKISGGERQRLAIARVLIRNPQILILDEATSSLDQESERLIQESIDSLAGRKTIIIISHHFSAIKNADLVYTLDAGRISDALRNSLSMSLLPNSDYGDY